MTTVTKMTLAQINDELINQASIKRHQIMSELGLKSESVVFDIIKGRRSCSQAERECIARIYGKDIAEIKWKRNAASSPNSYIFVTYLIVYDKQSRQYHNTGNH
jgi:hypothetical protein